MRLVLVVFFAFLTLIASGITTTIAATASGDDCCADAAGEQPSDERPESERDQCPPLCHACACSPTIALPSVSASAIVVRVVDRQVSVFVVSQLPSSPPGEGVFHPPRLAS